jgi:hypothetical protein
MILDVNYKDVLSLRINECPDEKTPITVKVKSKPVVYVFVFNGDQSMVVYEEADNIGHRKSLYFKSERQLHEHYMETKKMLEDNKSKFLCTTPPILWGHNQVLKFWGKSEPLGEVIKEYIDLSELDDLGYYE